MAKRPAKKTQPAEPAKPGKLDRWHTINTFRDEHAKRLTAGTGSGNAAFVWFMLFTMADGRTGLIRGASVSRLARLTGLKRDTVRSALRALIEMEHIGVEGDGAVPTYRMVHAVKCPDQEYEPDRS